MAGVETDRGRTGATWSLADLRDWWTAKSDGRARAISVPRRQGHAVPYPRYQPARVYRPSHIIGLHPLDQRGCDRPLQSRQGRHNCRRPRANKPLLVIGSPPRARWPPRLKRFAPNAIEWCDAFLFPIYRKRFDQRSLTEGGIRW